MKLIAALLCLLACTGAAAADTQAKIAAGIAKVFDPSVLHRIEITIAPEDAPLIVARTDTRLRCTIVFDGTVLKDVGIRQAGGPYRTYLPLSGKPSFSIKFDEFVKGQELHGLEKLVLKNGLQDASWVSEHMSYEVFRRAGLPAPMTAHAHVFANGIDLGLYVIREPVDGQFLTRNFGGNDGNLYEIGAQRAYLEFVVDPGTPELKDEVEDARRRDDLVRLAGIVRTEPPGQFARAVSPVLDLQRFIGFLAAEAATSHLDGFTWRNNNTYLYANPKDGRFVFIPYGMDQAFGGGIQPGMRVSHPLQPPLSALVQKIHSVPELRAQLEAEIRRIGGAAVWDRQVLRARVAQVARILGSAAKTPRLEADIARFEAYRPAIEGFIAAAGTTGNLSLPPPTAPAAAGR